MVMKSERYVTIKEFEREFGRDTAMNFVDRMGNIKAVFQSYASAPCKKESSIEEIIKLEIQYGLIFRIGTEYNRYLEAIGDLESVDNLKNSLEEIRSHYVKIKSILRSTLW